MIEVKAKEENTFLYSVKNLKKIIQREKDEEEKGRSMKTLNT